MAWIWDEDDKVYVDDETGERLELFDQIGIRDNLADSAAEFYTTWPLEEGEEPEDNDLVALLILGLIALSVFETRMQEAIEATVVAQYVFGLGGDENLTPEDKAIIDELLLVQYQFLNGMTNRIANDELSELQIAANAALYFSATVIGFEQGRRAAFDHQLQLPAMPGDGSSECLANDRCYWDIRDEGDIITAKWIRTVRESCPTCIRRAECPPVIFDKETGVHQNTSCYIS